jgi:hypothetical protein
LPDKPNKTCRWLSQFPSGSSENFRKSCPCLPDYQIGSIYIRELCKIPGEPNKKRVLFTGYRADNPGRINKFSAFKDQAVMKEGRYQNP